MPIPTDAVSGTHENDVLLGTEGADTIFGSCGDDWLFGDAGADRLWGGRGDDSIAGGAGRDTIVGGAGENLLSGGLGADVFVMHAHGMQHITDFRTWDGDRLLFRGDYVDSTTGLVDLDRLTVQDFGNDLVVLGQTNGEFQVLAILDDLAGYELGQLLTARQLGDIPNNTTTDAILDVGAPVSGEFEFGYDADWYRVDGEAGTYYAFEVTGDPSSADPAAASDIFLHDAEGHDLYNYTYQYTSDGIVVTFLQESDAPFFVEVVDRDGDPGDYLLTADILENDTIPGDPTTTETLDVGSTVSSSVDNPFDTDWFAVDLIAGETYAFSLAGDSTSSDPLSHPFLRLYDEDGSSLDVIFGGNDESEVVFYEAASDETVFASAEASYWSIGDYVLSVELFDNPDTIAGDTSTTATLDVGGSVTNAIDAPYDTDWFGVELTAGETYVFTLDSDDSAANPVDDPSFVLYDAEGNYIGENTDWNGRDSRLEYTPGSDELVYASAQAYLSNYGDYILSVDLI
jgi:hypothetical protein